MPRGRWTISWIVGEIASGVLLALAVFLVLIFLSPPLPFHDPTCATGWNDPVTLVFAIAFLATRHWFRSACCTGDSKTAAEGRE